MEAEGCEEDLAGLVNMQPNTTARLEDPPLHSPAIKRGENVDIKTNGNCFCYTRLWSSTSSWAHPYRLAHVDFRRPAAKYPGVYLGSTYKCRETWNKRATDTALVLFRTSGFRDSIVNRHGAPFRDVCQHFRVGDRRSCFGCSQGRPLV